MVVFWNLLSSSRYWYGCNEYRAWSNDWFTILGLADISLVNVNLSFLCLGLPALVRSSLGTLVLFPIEASRLLPIGFNGLKQFVPMVFWFCGVITCPPACCSRASAKTVLTPSSDSRSTPNCPALSFLVFFFSPSYGSLLFIIIFLTCSFVISFPFLFLYPPTPTVFLIDSTKLRDFFSTSFTCLASSFSLYNIIDTDSSISLSSLAYILEFIISQAFLSIFSSAASAAPAST